MEVSLFPLLTHKIVFQSKSNWGKGDGDFSYVRAFTYISMIASSICFESHRLQLIAMKLE